MTEDSARPGSVLLAQASNEDSTGGAEGIADRDLVTVTQPPDGGEVIYPSLADRVYDLRFDPRAAQVRVVDADGDGDLDVVLMFNGGTPEQSRIVFVDMVAAAQSGVAPAFQVGEERFGAELVVRQAQALAGEQPTLETAAPGEEVPQGSGASEYSDDLGNVIALLNPQGTIAGVSGSFPSLEPTVAEDDLLDEDLAVSVTDLFVVGSNEDDEDGGQEPHTLPDPNGGDDGPIDGGAGADILIGDPGGTIVGDLNVAILIDISGSMVNPDNNPAPGVTRLDVIQDALEEILPQLAGRDSTVNLFIETFARDSNAPLFVGELTPDNVDDIIVDILALDSQARGFTNYEAPLVDMRDYFLDQLAATDGFTNVAFFLTDGFPNRSLDDAGNVQGSGRLFQQAALDEALAAIPDLLDPSSGVFSGEDEILLNAIGTSNALASTLDLFDTTGGADLVDLGDPSTLSDALAISGVGVGEDVITGGDGFDIIFGDVPNTDGLALDEGIDLPPGSGFAVFQALEAGESASSPDWSRADTISYLRDPANGAEIIGSGRGEADTIDAGGGDDVIFGQGGDDVLTGGSGADTYVYTLGADEDDDRILDFSTDDLDLFAFVNVTDRDSSGVIDIDDVVDSFVDGGGAGAVDTLVLHSGTTIMLTDISGAITDLAAIEANSIINNTFA